MVRKAQLESQSHLGKLHKGFGLCSLYAQQVQETIIGQCWE